MAFTTKIDFSNNRQVKQHEKTISNLSGGTSFGLTFSALTSGPDLTTIAITSGFTNLNSTFSGNSGSTTYYWSNSDMILGETSLSAITPLTSGTTQIASGYIPTSSTVIDGNTVITSYSGVSYDVNVQTMVDLGSGNYSGTIFTFLLETLTTGSLGFMGRTIWVDVSGITRTEKLILTNLDVFADNTAASSLETGTVYRTSTGQLMIKF